MFINIYIFEKASESEIFAVEYVKGAQIKKKKKNYYNIVYRFIVFDLKNKIWKFYNIT